MNMQAEELKIGDVCQVGDGAHASIKRQESGVLYLSSRNFKDGCLDLTKVYYISEDDFDKHFKDNSKAITKTKGGDVALSIIGTIGEPYVVKSSDRFGLSSAVAFLRPDFNKVDSHYLYYWLKSPEFQQAVYNVKGGVAQGYVSLEMIKGLPFRYFHKEYQVKISKYLKNYDNLIENNNRRIAILEDMAQSLYHEWFVSFRYPNYQDNLDADGNPKLIDSPLGKIPEGWEDKPLGELIEFKRKTIKKGSVPVNTPYMGLEHFPRKSIALSDWEEVSEIGSNKLAFNRGDILFGKIRPNFHKVGVAQVYGLCSSDAFVLAPKEPAHHSLIAMVTFSNEFVAQAVQTAQGSKMPRASWDVLKEFPVCIPDSNALEIFNSVVNPAIEQIRVLSLKNRNLKQQRDMLLPKLISGKIKL